MPETRRSPWLLARAETLVTALRDRHGLDIDVDTAAHDVAAWRDQIAQRLRIQPRSAQVYVTDDALAEFADHIAQCVRDAEKPPAPVIDIGEKRRERYTRPPTA
ncbi:hypothetical protein [Mycolicibacterium llatzerense]|uniref:hypothetical protein n=1 Tax=Mycolicibacterium llatzerense TaxID=280871 RepID=UPI0021B53705|nr:hypothetical protein [Mycolicibacterium llatzerense]MCT7373374.1 hypothetical protein [Mycolicibacterium llatzerense]